MVEPRATRLKKIITLNEKSPAKGSLFLCIYFLKILSLYFKKTIKRITHHADLTVYKWFDCSERLNSILFRM